jgi:hypothetical protein
MRFVILAASMLAVLIGVATLSGCLSTYRTDARGQRYHEGDRWEMYRLDKNYNAHRVK